MNKIHSIEGFQMPNQESRQEKVLRWSIESLHVIVEIVGKIDVLTLASKLEKFQERD